MENWLCIVIIADIAQDFTFLAFDLNFFFQEHMFTFFPRDIICIWVRAPSHGPVTREGDTRHTQLWIHVRDHSSGLAMHSSPREGSLNINTASIQIFAPNLHNSRDIDHFSCVLASIYR